MKKFIVISLLAAIVLPAKPCAWVDNHNDYLFSPYNPQEFRSRVERITNDNWKVYLGSDKEYFWFNADEVIEAARKKNDPLMVSYIENLQKYLDCVAQKRSEQWEYPTKEQLAERTATLQAIRAYAQGKLKTRLRSQHALLVMRCNMMLGRHADNVTFWNTSGAKMIESVYRDMMLNIYAGALYKTGSEEAAAALFAEQGDWESLMTMYYNRRSYTAIRQEYLRDPNSAVLPFLLRDFVNNTQEAVDGPDELQGKLFVRNISKAEARQMCQLAAQAVKEGKTQTPALWQSAKAWLEFLIGDRRQAATDIVAAAKMEGTERMKDNVRVLMLYITSAQAPVSTAFNEYLADELQWLGGKTKEDNFFLRAQDRLVHQVLAAKYNRQPTTAVALLKATDCSLYYEYIDTMRVDRLEQFISYAAAPATTPLDKVLKQRLQVEQNSLNDLVGTKYLRLCQWQKALPWLQKVPLSFYNARGYAVYAANRHWTVEPWLKRQWLKAGLEYSDRKWNLKSNPKIDFAREMQNLESGLALLQGKAAQQRYYDLAVRYAQACFTGDCWFLTHDGKSEYDTVHVNEVDLRAKALTMLRKASQTTDFALKEKALFAMSYGYLYSDKWYENEWDSSVSKYVTKPMRLSAQYKAMAALANLEKQNAARTSQYVSRCDEFLQFRKTYNQ